MLFIGMQAILYAVGKIACLIGRGLLQLELRIGNIVCHNGGQSSKSATG
jgi:hypothetical protein